MRRSILVMLVILVILLITHTEVVEEEKPGGIIPAESSAVLYPQMLYYINKQLAENEWKRRSVLMGKSVFLQNSGDTKSVETAIELSFAGDCTLGTDEMVIPYEKSFVYRLKQENNDFGYFFSNVRTIFERDDLTIVNLEGTFTNLTEKAKKKFRFKGDPSYVNILKSGGIEMVNISNNHIYDFLKQGFKDTLNCLENAGIKYSGEGYTAYYDVSGVTVASLGYNAWNTSIKSRILKDIKSAGKKADIIIISFHWGTEYDYYPSRIQTELGRFCIDNGADIVIGHHPHVIQGIERYKDRYIVYSLGNFCFGGNYKPRDMYSFIFQNKFIVKDGMLVESVGKVIPCMVSSVTNVNNYQPAVLSGDEADELFQRLYKYSSALEYGVKPGEVEN